jgi:hypothetical protein
VAITRTIFALACLYFVTWLIVLLLCLFRRARNRALEALYLAGSLLPLAVLGVWQGFTIDGAGVGIMAAAVGLNIAIILGTRFDPLPVYLSFAKRRAEEDLEAGEGDAASVEDLASALDKSDRERPSWWGFSW